jgi:hypothetical protein
VTIFPCKDCHEENGCTQSTFQQVFNKVKINSTALMGDLNVKTRLENEGLER